MLKTKSELWCWFVPRERCSCHEMKQLKRFSLFCFYVKCHKLNNHIYVQRVCDTKPQSVHTFIQTITLSCHPRFTTRIQKLNHNCVIFNEEILYAKQGQNERAQQHKPIIINLISLINCSCIIMWLKSSRCVCYLLLPQNLNHKFFRFTRFNQTKSSQHFNWNKLCCSFSPSTWMLCWEKAFNNLASLINQF